MVITVKSDKLGKTALDSRKPNDSCLRKRPHKPNKEEILNQISVENTRDRIAFFISKIDFEFAYGQKNLSKELSGKCVFAINWAADIINR